jgi:hypothetical protein
MDGGGESGGGAGADGCVFCMIGGADEVTRGRVSEFGEGGYKFTDSGSKIGREGWGICRGGMV